MHPPARIEHADMIDRFALRRRPARLVRIGDTAIGGDRPVLVQSMCTTPTQDVAATVAQCIRLAEAGCELVRITAPGVKDAQALAPIRRQFSAAGFAHIPLCADIHFMPAAAMEAVEHVEKVRVKLKTESTPVAQGFRPLAEGLRPGDTLVLDPPVRLGHGDRVRSKS